MLSPWHSPPMPSRISHTKPGKCSKRVYNLKWNKIRLRSFRNFMSLLCLLVAPREMATGHNTSKTTIKTTTTTRISTANFSRALRSQSLSSSLPVQLPFPLPKLATDSDSSWPGYHLPELPPRVSFLLRGLCSCALGKYRNYLAGKIIQIILDKGICGILKWIELVTIFP